MGAEAVLGLSPLARGNRNELGQGGRRRGPIPARAGQPLLLRRQTHPQRAYPRSRGATCALPDCSIAASGLSPLARGNRVGLDQVAGLEGPIPARAGQPRLAVAPNSSPWAYPRSRGATACRRSSPRCSRAYPRSRGATVADSDTLCSLKGLSPLARGNLAGDQAVVPALGPIPARAGQPGQPGAVDRHVRAYPRSRGATSCSGPTWISVQGLSPLARGNHGDDDGSRVRRGPIPARAGQPITLSVDSMLSRAYPRSRGATTAFARCAPACSGLSPLARGNQQHDPGHLGLLGPIPARAGQPAAEVRHARHVGAYPRSRGATSKGSSRRSACSGLSPLARGNRCALALASQDDGPIPARAGQPAAKDLLAAYGRAYPRSRGATMSETQSQRDDLGLSPLARGNPRDDLRATVNLGPIPARAGQPRWRARSL